MPHDVFVSHSNKDKPVTDAVVASLENSGIRCWVAPRDITPGSSWGQAIINAIEASQFMVIILSGNSNQSNQVTREVEMAVSKDIIIIPFRIEKIDPTGSMAYFLPTEHWLDAFVPPLEEHLSRLAGKVQGMLSPKGVSLLIPEMVLPTKPDTDASHFERETESVQQQNDSTKAHEESAQVGDEDSPWKFFMSNLPLHPSDISGVHDRWETLNQLRRSLALSVDTLRSNPIELPSQLSGRLANSTNAGVINFLSSLNHKVQHPWFRPRSTCLPGPDSPILASWSILDDVPACRLLISGNSKVVSAVARNKKWFWDLETGLSLTDIEADPHFSNVDWTNWSTNLPDRQFEDSELQYSWVASTPPGPFTVTCSLDRTGGSAFNRSYNNLVTSGNRSDMREISRSMRSAVFAEEGFLAPSISTTSNKIICGGLAGVISIWDLNSGTLEFTTKIGNRTIVAIAAFQDLKRCVVLTLDGQLLIVETTVNSKREETDLAPPLDLFLSRDFPIAVVTHINGSVSVWSTQTGYSIIRRPDWYTGSPYANFRLTPDLSVAIVTGHGEDNYDGWLLNVVNLVSGDELFACETSMSSQMFGPISLEKHDNSLYLRIDPLGLKTASSGASRSYSDVPNWVSLNSGRLYQSEPPSQNGKLIKWARPSFIKGKIEKSGFAPWFKDKINDPDFGSEEIILSGDLRTIIACSFDNNQTQFTIDEDIYLLGISPYDKAIAFVTRAELHALDLIGIR